MNIEEYNIQGIGILIPFGIRCWKHIITRTFEQFMSLRKRKPQFKQVTNLLEYE